jgi:uncharacterized membrane protein YfcA
MTASLAYAELARFVAVAAVTAIAFWYFRRHRLVPSPVDPSLAPCLPASSLPWLPDPAWAAILFGALLMLSALVTKYRRRREWESQRKRRARARVRAAEDERRRRLLCGGGGGSGDGSRARQTRLRRTV